MRGSPRGCLPPDLKNELNSLIIEPGKEKVWQLIQMKNSVSITHRLSDVPPGEVISLRLVMVIKLDQQKPQSRVELVFCREQLWLQTASSRHLMSVQSMHLACCRTESLLLRASGVQQRVYQLSRIHMCLALEYLSLFK